MQRKICNGNGELCWSLHALWDAEILKLTYNNNNTTNYNNNTNYNNINGSLKQETKSYNPDSDSLHFDFDLKFWTLKMNRILCIIYMSPTNTSIQKYAEYHKYLALNLINLVSRNTAAILNSKTKLFC